MSFKRVLSWGLGLLVVVLLFGLLVRSTIPRMPGMPITGGMPVDSKPEALGQSDPNAMPGMNMKPGGFP